MASIPIRPIGNTVKLANGDTLDDGVPRRIEQITWKGFTLATHTATISFGAEEFLRFVAGAASGYLRVPCRKTVPMKSNGSAYEINVTTDSGDITLQFEEDQP